MWKRLIVICFFPSWFKKKNVIKVYMEHVYVGYLFKIFLGITNLMAIFELYLIE